MTRVDESGERKRLRAKVMLAVVIVIAGLLTTARNFLSSGWDRGTIVAAIASVPIGVALYFVIIRRWLR